MSFTLRPHQAENKDQLRVELRTYRSVNLVAECGYGKGVITQDLIANAVERSRYVLFLVHGKDRVNDAHDRATKLDIPHGVLMSGVKRERWHHSQIASSDTVFRMEHKPKADLIIIDESHLAMSPTFRAVLDFYPNAKIIGLTATPMLGNGRALGVKSGGIFESMVKGPSVNWLIANKQLVGSRVFAPPAPKELNGLDKKKTGEFDGEKGAAICDNSKVIGDIIDHWKRYASERKTAVFGFNQKHAFDIAESFRAAGVNWAYVDADTPDGDAHTPFTRKFYWDQMAHGDLVGVSSVATINLGWDMPICKNLILAAKTSSFPLYRQRLGRGSRPYKDYKEFYVFDHCGGLYEFQDKGPYFESEIDWQLDGDPVRVKDEDKARRVTTCNVPLLVPDSGVPTSFTGPVDRGYMLPCLRPFAAGPKQCPYCGLSLERAGREIEVEDGELGEITQEMRDAVEAKIRAESARKAEYLDLTRVAKEKKYKPAYPGVVFRNRHGFWPPKGWKEEVEMVVGQ